MKIGDLIICNLDNRLGLLIQDDWYTDIGTPFDWLVMWCDDGTFEGADNRYIEVVA